MPAMLFDLDGVLYEGDRAIDGAADAVRWFVDNHIPHLFLTNTTSKPRTALVDRLANYGIHTRSDDFLTPPVAACQWLQEKKLKHIALFVPEQTAGEFSGFELHSNENDTVDAVIIGDLGEQWDFTTMNHVFHLLVNNPQAELIALGMTRYWQTASGQLQLDVGPMVKAFEYASGRNAVVTGKPARTFFNAARQLLGMDELVMIGDDIRGDIEAAQKAGLKAILVRTGKFRESDLDMGIRPDEVLNSVAELPAWWQRAF